jgi:hypothetical protein
MENKIIAFSLIALNEFSSQIQLMKICFGIVRYSTQKRNKFNLNFNLNLIIFKIYISITFI